MHAFSRPICLGRYQKILFVQALLIYSFNMCNKIKIHNCDDYSASCCQPDPCNFELPFFYCDECDLFTFVGYSTV